MLLLVFLRRCSLWWRCTGAEGCPHAGVRVQPNQRAHRSAQLPLLQCGGPAKRESQLQAGQPLAAATPVNAACSSQALDAQVGTCVHAQQSGCSKVALISRATTSSRSMHVRCPATSTSKQLLALAVAHTLGVVLLQLSQEIPIMHSQLPGA
jgi:hypothetical protein